MFASVLTVEIEPFPSPLGRDPQDSHCLPRSMLGDSAFRGFIGFIYLVPGVLISQTVTPSLAPSLTTTYRRCERLPLATFKQSAHMESAFPPSYIPGIYSKLLNGNSPTSLSSSRYTSGFQANGWRILWGFCSTGRSRHL